MSTATASSQRPGLTVYTLGHHSVDDCLDVLEDLRRQTIADQIEIVVVAPDAGSLTASDYDEFFSWRWVQVDSVEDTGTAMAVAMRAATADFAVYAEEHATFDEDWAERIVQAHHHGYDVVGFAMENANPRTATSWAHFYSQFGPVVTPVESGEIEFLAGHHVSYRCSLILGYGEHTEAALEDESALFLELRERGVPLYLEGGAISQHLNISHFPSLGKIEFVGMRSFAASRAALHRWPAWKRLAFALATPLVPAVRAARVWGHLTRTGRRGLLPRLLPVLTPVLALGAVGEAAGYLFGAGRSAKLKMPIELSRLEYVARADRTGG